MSTELEGELERFTYTSEEDGFTIAKVKIPGHRDPVTVVGNLFSLSPGELLQMTGEWVNHPRYGKQFKVSQYKSKLPASLHGIEKYLGSGLIRGIGPVMAKRIVGRFAEDTLEIIEHHVRKLSQVPGIGRKRIEMIKEAWEEHKDIRDVMLFLQTHGVSSSYAVRIFKQYGSDSIRTVRENPYRLAEEIHGIGFRTADSIAGKLGFQRDSPLRVEAGILYVLHELTDEGHVCYPHDALLGKCQEILEVESAVLKTALSAISAEGRVVLEDPPAAPGNPLVYLQTLHLCETGIAAKLRSLLLTAKSIREIRTEKALEWVQEQLTIGLAEKQVEAVRSAILEKVLVVTGGPGTGKTTIINAILKIFSKLPIQIMLAAPTGRAAKRMSELTGHEAKTIHRMLEYSPQKRAFQRNEKSPLKCDLLVVDEASMIDTVLMHQLLKAVPMGATLVLVGDVHQLPSVGPGNVLKDIIGSGSVRVIELNEIFRQAEASSIVVNAHRIINGDFPNLEPAEGRLPDFFFFEQEEPQDALDLILKLVMKRIPEKFGLKPLRDIQVLTPMHRGLVGAQNLNTELQQAFNPRPEGLTRGGKVLRPRDKIMQVRNNYDKGIFNGDIGWITGIDAENQQITASFDGRPVKYESAELEEITLAYAISVHKSQGSEYPAVVIPVLMQHYMLLQRNLIYTAITRGKDLVVLVGSKKALAIGIRNDQSQQRFSRLRERLSGP